VREKNRWVRLNMSLQMHFPVSNDDYVSEYTMRDYWDSNGKAFPWTRLPTELKEHVFQFCVCKSNHNSKFPRPGAYEIVDQLGEWCGLLKVSRQVRALALRVVTVHNDMYPGGLCIVSNSLHAFQDSFNRLGWYFQVKEDNSIPTDAWTEVLAKRYMDYPKQFPQLSRFALMRHGIRKLNIQFNWLDALYFFKVSIGSLDQWRPKSHITYEVFEKLPNLDGLRITLPNQWQNHEPVIRRGPKLFREEDPCPRVLHRMIYESIATHLASYSDLSVTGFMDVDEGQLFSDHREAAILSLKMTVEESKELYAECGGGVQLDVGSDVEIEEPHESTLTVGKSTSWTLNWSPSPLRHQTRFEEPAVLPEDTDDIFPPRCFCDIPCSDAFFL
jgi:hypothetical protein